MAMYNSGKDQKARTGQLEKSMDKERKKIELKDKQERLRKAACISKGGMYRNGECFKR